MQTKVISEHERIPYDSDSLRDYWGEGMRLSGQSKGQERWFFRWEWRTPAWGEGLPPSQDVLSSGGAGYYASYVIGAQWLDAEHSIPLVVTPKEGCARIDFLRMFSQSLASGIASEEFAKIYTVDLDQPRIVAPELRSVLSPLIVVHFLSVVRTVVRQGLKRDYIVREENLNKVKGRIDMMRNERTNVREQRFDRVCCRYQEYSEDIPENRLIKKALLFAREVVRGVSSSSSALELDHIVGQCLAAFARVDDQIEPWEVRSVKNHKLYKGYCEAIRLAQMILRRYDYSITQVTAQRQESCPVFWLDVALLYEHYVLGLLRAAYGERIEYQAKGRTGYPDFVCYAPKLIMDTKYMPQIAEQGVKTEIIRQLSGYARDRGLFADAPAALVPCLVLYPRADNLGQASQETNPFIGKSLETLLEEAEGEQAAWGFYRLAVPLPTITPQ